VAVALFLMSAAFLMARTGRDALYLTAGGIHTIPGAYLGIATLSVPAAFGMLGAMRRFGPRRVRVFAPILVAGTLAVFAATARPGGGPLMTAFFILVPLLFGVLFSATWLLCADLLDGTPRRDLARAYSLVGAGSILGGLAGAVAARLVGDVAGPRELIAIAAGVTAAGGLVVDAAQLAFPTRLQRGSADTPAPIGPLLRMRYPLLLLLIAMTGSLVGVLIEFQLYLAAAASGNDAHANARFFATVYTVLNAMALGVQVFLAPRLQGAIGVGGSLLILPTALLTGVLLGGASLFARSMLRVMDGGLKASIHRVNWEQAYLPLARTQRASAKVLVDGAGARVAEATAALILLAWLQLVVRGGSVVGRSTSWITVLLVAALAAWVGLTQILVRRLRTAAGADATDEMRIAIPLPDS